MIIFDKPTHAVPLFQSVARGAARCACALFVLLLCACNGSPGNATENEHPGKKVYTRYCFSCHQGGVANSPTFGVREEWESRLSKGREALIKSTIEGIPPGMPIRGLCMGCTDSELADAVDYMLEALKPESE